MMVTPLKLFKPSSFVSISIVVLHHSDDCGTLVKNPLGPFLEEEPEAAKFVLHPYDPFWTKPKDTWKHCLLVKLYSEL
jgi:hypothetical protein